MNNDSLEDKTFICYPDFAGMKERVFAIILFIIFGLFFLLSYDILNLKKYNIEELTMNIFGCCFLLLAIFTFLATKLYIKKIKYILTNKRLTIEKGIATKRISNLELWRVIDIELTQNFIQHIFGGCTVKLDTDDFSDPIIYINGLNIKYAMQVYELINYFVDKSIKSRLVNKLKK